MILFGVLHFLQLGVRLNTDCDNYNKSSIELGTLIVRCICILILVVICLSMIDPIHVPTSASWATRASVNNAARSSAQNLRIEISPAASKIGPTTPSRRSPPGSIEPPFVTFITPEKEMTHISNASGPPSPTDRMPQVDRRRSNPTPRLFTISQGEDDPITVSTTSSSSVVHSSPSIGRHHTFSTPSGTHRVIQHWPAPGGANRDHRRSNTLTSQGTSLIISPPTTNTSLSSSSSGSSSLAASPIPSSASLVPSHSRGPSSRATMNSPAAAAHIQPNKLVSREVARPILELRQRSMPVQLQTGMRAHTNQVIPCDLVELNRATLNQNPHNDSISTQTIDATPSPSMTPTAGTHASVTFLHTLDGIRVSSMAPDDANDPSSHHTIRKMLLDGIVQKEKSIRRRSGENFEHPLTIYEDVQVIENTNTNININTHPSTQP